jgi:hypothetical protein
VEKVEILAQQEGAIAEAKNTLIYLVSQYDRLLASFNRADNEALGFAGSANSGQVGAKEKAAFTRGEADRIKEKLVSAKLLVDEKRAEIAALEAAWSAAGDPASILGLRQGEYRDLVAQRAELDKRGADFDAECELAAPALKAAEQSLAAAQRKRLGALSLDDVAAASTAESAAQAHKANVEGLLGNIKSAQQKLDAERLTLRDELEKAKRATYSASAAASVDAIQRDPAFLSVKDEIERAFSAFTLSRPGGASFSLFLMKVFGSQDGSVDGGALRLAALQEDVAKNLEISGA